METDFDVYYELQYHIKDSIEVSCVTWNQLIIGTITKKVSEKLTWALVACSLLGCERGYGVYDAYPSHVCYADGGFVCDEGNIELSEEEKDLLNREGVEEMIFETKIVVGAGAHVVVLKTFGVSWRTPPTTADEEIVRPVIDKILKQMNVKNHPSGPIKR